MRTSRARRGERGSASVEAALLAVPILALVSLGLLAGRLSGAQDAVEAAAQDAARAASISRTAEDGQAAATTAVREATAEQQLACPDPQVQAHTEGLAAPVGEVAEVSVTVRCSVPLETLVVLPVPGRHEVSAQAESVVDRFRQRG